MRTILPGWSYRLQPADYPTRETALAIIDALNRDEASDWSELEKLAGVPNIQVTAERCHMVYGYRELAPGEAIKRLSEVFMRRRSEPHTPTPTTPQLEPKDEPKARPNDAFGFTPRDH